MRVNSKCAHRVRPPLRGSTEGEPDRTRESFQKPGSDGEEGIESSTVATFAIQEDLMARRQWFCVFAFVLAVVEQPVAPRAQQQTPGARSAIAVRTATVDGVSVQYLSAGSGPAIVLLHGYAEHCACGGH